MQGHMISLPYTPQVLHCRYVGDITSDVSISWGLSGRLLGRGWLFSTLKPISGLFHWGPLNWMYSLEWNSVEAGPHILPALGTVGRGPLGKCKNRWPPFFMQPWIITNSSLSRWPLFQLMFSIFLLLIPAPTPLSNFLLRFVSFSSLDVSFS